MIFKAVIAYDSTIVCAEDENARHHFAVLPAERSDTHISAVARKSQSNYLPVGGMPLHFLSALFVKGGDIADIISRPGGQRKGAVVGNGCRYNVVLCGGINKCTTAFFYFISLSSPVVNEGTVSRGAHGGVGISMGAVVYLFSVGFIKHKGRLAKHGNVASDG